MPKHRAESAAAEAAAHPWLATVVSEQTELALREARSSYYGLISGPRHRTHQMYTVVA
eukprot:COSAG01_NODE_12717_length_1695_cov_1.251253_2_plen_58_part_00